MSIDENQQIPIQRILFSEEAIQKRLRELGAQISADYSVTEDLVIIGVLKGSFYFMSDLSRQLSVPLILDFMGVSTYPTATSQQGIVRITKDLDIEITGKHVLLIEDIIRTGLTTAYLVKNLQVKDPASVRICTLLANPNQLLINLPIEYTGFEISETRLVGYGMDMNERGRSLPYIAEIRRETNP